LHCPLTTIGSCIASDRIVLVLSETVLVLDGCLNCGDADSLIQAVLGSSRTIGPKCSIERFSFALRLLLALDQCKKSCKALSCRIYESWPHRLVARHQAWCCVRVAELQQLLCEDAQSIRPDRMARKKSCATIENVQAN